MSGVGDYRRPPARRFGPWRKAPLVGHRPVDDLKPIRPSRQTGQCSRCRGRITDPSKTVRLGDGSLAHRYHFHAYDLVGADPDG